jgi:hypothetical protein
MSHLEARPGSATSPDAPRRLARWVCTSNPFYVLSALLVCLGLWVSFGKQDQAAQTWALLSGMAGYTLLLAATACLLVRYVGVWDDVRTIMLLVVLMILATSVTFDEILARDPARGVACSLAGLLSAAAVSEGMLRGARLALPPLFRGPYHLALALFFLYPAALAPLLDRPWSESLEWALFGFTPAAGVVALGLLPAARRGRGHVRDNGSPWRWAWYPWTPFGVLAFGVAARSALLCWSMHHVARGSGAEPYIFGPYFLVPFLLAVAVVLLEIGLVERLGGVRLAALAMPALLLILAVVGHRPEATYQGFLARFEARLGGTPLYLTVIASSAFYAYAALRHVPRAFDALCGALALLAVVGPGTLDLGGLVAPRPSPLLAVAALQTALGLRRRDAWRCLVGAACLTACATIVLPEAGVLPARARGPVAYHLLLGALLAVGAGFDDALGRWLRGAGAALALLGCLAVLTGRPSSVGAPPAWAPWLYPPILAVLLAGYGSILSHRPSLTCAGLILASWLVAAIARGYGLLRLAVAGLDYILLGLVAFTLAVLVSMLKGGVLPVRIASLKGGGSDSPGCRAET